MAEEVQRQAVRLLIERDELARSRGIIDWNVADRARASTIERNMPEIPDMVRLNRAFLRGMFEGFELLEPGVVGCAEWHPGGPGDFSEETEANELFYAVVGKKRVRCHDFAGIG